MKIYSDIIDQIKEIIVPILEQEDAVLVELNFIRASGRPILKMLVDKKEGGVSLQECAKLNEIIGQALDAQGLLQEGYILEVSSPGLDRPLKIAEDFLRCIGRQAVFFLSEPVNAKLEWCGLITKVEGGLLYLDVNGDILNIPLAKINKSMQTIE